MTYYYINSILLFSPGMMEESNASSSSCTVDGNASVSCVDSTSSGYQVILLQDNDPYNLTVVNVTSGEKQTVPVVANGKYCIMEIYQWENIIMNQKLNTPENSLQKKII